MAKHTPGPWSSTPSVRSFEAQVWDAAGAALLFFADGRATGPEADANAALIAAAPDLLAALKDMLANYHVLGFNADKRREEARAAIAKAEGR